MMSSSRPLKHGVGQALFGESVLEADRPGLLSDEHSTVDGTLIETAASLMSFKPRDDDPPRKTRRWTLIGNDLTMPHIRALRTRSPGCMT